MLKAPTPENGALIKLQQFLDQRQLKRPRRYAVVTYGLLEKPQDFHGIFFLCDVFDTYDEAEKLVDEIMKTTGITHVKVIPVGSSDLLTNQLDPEKVRIVADGLEMVERENIKERLMEEEKQKRIQELVNDEKKKLEDPESLIAYGHLWTKYIQNRTIREHFQRVVAEYSNLEKARQEQICALQAKYPSYEKEWFRLFSEYRHRVDETAAAEQIRTYWEKYRKDVFPDLY